MSDKIYFFYVINYFKMKNGKITFWKYHPDQIFYWKVITRMAINLKFVNRKKELITKHRCNIASFIAPFRVQNVSPIINLIHFRNFYVYFIVLRPQCFFKGIFDDFLGYRHLIYIYNYILYNLYAIFRCIGIIHINILSFSFWIRHNYRPTI